MRCEQPSSTASTLQPGGGLIKSEPMALATGLKATNVPVLTPEASAYGSQNNAFLSGQPGRARLRARASGERASAAPAAVQLRSRVLKPTSPVRVYLQAGRTASVPAVLKSSRGLAPQAQQSLMAQLTREVRQLETAGRNLSHPPISSGCAALDACLPEAGYLPGSVIEYLRATPACGASYLAWAAAASALAARGSFLIVVDSAEQHVYPPALRSHGIDLAKVVFVRPRTSSEAVWVVDQAVRCPAVAAVVAPLERLDDRDARRLQLAAEAGGGLAFLLRSAAARRQPSWAEVQWLVRSAVDAGSPLAVRSASPRKLHVQLARIRGGAAGASVRLEVNPVTGSLQAATDARRERNRHEQQGSPTPGTVHLASQLARPTDRSGRAAAG